MRTYTPEEIKEVFRKVVESFKRLGEALNRLDSKEFLTNPKSRYHK